MIILALIGCIYLAQFIANSQTIYNIKWYLAKFKIRYNKENKDYPIGTQVKSLKPFDCVYCLSFWFSLTILILSGYYITALPTAFLIYKLSKLLIHD